MKMKIAIDVDGVCADLVTAWLSRYNRDYDDSLTVNDIAAWDIHKFVKPECGEKMYRYLDDKSLYDDVAPIPNALATVDTIRGMGHEVYFVTSSMPNSMGRKYWWLDGHGFGVDPKHYIEASSKGMILADILIDDYVENLREFHGKGILFPQPYNLDALFQPRAHDWIAILAIIRSFGG